MFDAAPTKKPTFAGMNLAPLEPLRKIKELDKPYECSDMHSTFREIYQDIKKRNEEERRQIAESGRLMSALRSGKANIKRDPVFGTIVPLLKPLPQHTGSDVHVYPLAQINSTQLTSIWSLSRPRTVPQQFGSTNRAQIQVALAEQVINHYDSTLEEDFHQFESLSAMDFGTIAIRVQYDTHLNRMTQVRPIVADQEKTVFPGYGYCRDCQKEGGEDDFRKYSDLKPQCPECGSYNVSDVVPKQKAMVTGVVGVEYVHQGDISISLLQIPSINWDMRKFIQDSPYVNVRTEVPKALVETMLAVEVNEEDPSLDVGLRVLNAMGTRGGSVVGYGRDNTEGNYVNPGGTAIMDELWLKPEMYAGKRAPKDEKTVSGQTIRKDTYYTDIFPNGVCLASFNEMNILAGVFTEECDISSTVYHIQSNSGVGKGTTDAIEIAEHLDIAHSAAMAIIKRYAAGGGHWYDNEVMSETQAKALLRPGGLVGIKMRGTQYTSVDQAIRRIETGSLDQQNLNMIAQLSNMLNIVFQTTDFTTGVADNRVDVNTLGGQQLLQAQNQQRSAAPLRMKAFLRTKVFESVLRLFRENMVYPRFFGNNDKYSLSKGRFISGADIPERIKCYSAPDSEHPTNRLTRRDNFERLLEKTGQAGTPFLDIAQQNPRFAAWMAQEFDVSLPMFNYTEILITCQNRLDTLKSKVEEQEQISQLAGYMGDPKAIAEQIVDELLPPITPAEDNLVIKAQVISEYLDDDEVSTWSPLEMAAVTALIWRHYTADRDFRGQRASMEQDTQLNLQAKAAKASQAIQAPMMEAENDQAMQNELASRAADLIGEEEKHSRDQEAADNQAAREEMLAQSQHERDRAAAVEDHKRNLALERVRQQGRNKPSTKGDKKKK